MLPRKLVDIWWNMWFFLLLDFFLMAFFVNFDAFFPNHGLDYPVIVLFCSACAFCWYEMFSTYYITQGPGRLSVGIWVAKRHGHQISSISCCFVLWKVLSQTKYCCSLKVKIFGSKKFSGWLCYCPWACSKNNSMISVFTLRNISVVNTKIKVIEQHCYFRSVHQTARSLH